MGDIRRRRDEHTDGTRQALVSSAKDRFTRLGYLGTSLDDIADQARVSKGAIYHHFENKRALFEAVLVRTCEEMIAQIDTELKHERTETPTVTEVLEAYLSAATADSFRRLSLQESPVALGWERSRHLADEMVVQPLSTLLAGHCGGNLQAPISRYLLLPTIVSALNELATAIMSSPDPAEARSQGSQLIAELAGSLWVNPTSR